MSFFGHTAGRAIRIAYAGIMLLGSRGALAQAAQAEPPAALRFFLTEAPPASVLSGLPPHARRAFVAKVRVLSIWPTSPPEWPPASHPIPHIPYQMRAELEVTATVAGAHVWWRRQRVEFGSTARADGRLLYPLPTERDRREYFVVAFLDENGVRALLGFQATGEDYEAWYRELNQPYTK